MNCNGSVEIDPQDLQSFVLLSNPCRVTFMLRTSVEAFFLNAQTRRGDHAEHNKGLSKIQDKVQAKIHTHHQLHDWLNRAFALSLTAATYPP